MQVPTDLLLFSETADAQKKQAVVDIAGAVYDSSGHVGAQFKEHVTIDSNKTESPDGKRRDLLYTYPIHLPPGLYQVRVAARDQNSARTGSAQQWIEIPDLKKGTISLSSLIIGERADSGPTTKAASQNESNTPNLSVDHLFRNSSYLRFVIFIYNASRNAVGVDPDLAAQIQIVRDGQPVMTTSIRKVQTEGTSPGAIPYAADVPLNDFPAGLYLMRVTIIDRTSKTSAAQQTRFEIH